MLYFNYKTVIKPLTNKKLLIQLKSYKLFIKEPGITNHLKAFKNYERSYTVEVTNSQDLTSQFNITKAHVKNLLEDLLAEVRGFNYQITLQITFCKEIENDETKHSPPVYFDANAQTVTIYILMRVLKLLCQGFKNGLMMLLFGYTFFL